MFGAVMSVSGQALRKEFRKQEELMKLLGTTAEKVKMGRDKEVRAASAGKSLFYSTTSVLNSTFFIETCFY